ncbi:MAG: hypothetical protein COU40_00735 [Candidatus Moranbacteria bacterium CG10_big_fil_rev_8_21_14_0_10_35_21]|nr:MAG: hypothetical protein COU40_00735 [Candidatus Moranbacteria bacterium CG10_big_fil_rev_8_21_14_0_10_35_21]PJA88955.1 MAG: hypothetical protein CO139_00370 [Candidatus Moranbacteria bacterium CG_4_9_14_3_um_filter_36_9]
MKNFFKKVILFPRSLILNARSFFSQEFFKKNIVRWLLGVSLLANIADWVVLKIFIKSVDFPIILHYNVYFGVDMLGDWKRVFFLPLIGIILIIINLFLAIYFFNRQERIASYLLLMAILMIQLSLVISSVSLIVINY